MARSTAATITAILLFGMLSVPLAGAAPLTSVTLNGDGDEWVSYGRDWSYNRSTAIIHASYRHRHLQVRVHGDDGWYGYFPTPRSLRRLVVGRYTIDGPGVWGGTRHCSDAVGWYEIDDIEYRSGELFRLDMHFAQRCRWDADSPALRGRVTWDATEWTPRVRNPRSIPDGLWRPRASSIPDHGNVVYLEPPPGGEYVGGTLTQLYRPRPDEIEIREDGGVIFIHMDVGDHWWYGNFAAPALTPWIRSGYYRGVNRYPFENVLEGGEDWSGDGRGCNEYFGWFTTDRVKMVAGRLRALKLRFEQRCDSPTTPALHGFVRWRAASPRPQQPWSDLVGHRYERALTRVAAKGWIPGYNDGTFRPHGDVTRGQIATYVHRALGLGRPSADAPRFTDIADSSHRRAIRRLAEEGIVSGFKDGTYRPNRRVSRGLLAKVVYRAFLRGQAPWAVSNYFFLDTSGTSYERPTRALINHNLDWPVRSGLYRTGDRATRGYTALLLARAKNLVARLRVPP